MDVLAAIAAPSVSIVVGNLLYGVVLGVVTFMAMAGVRRRTAGVDDGGRVPRRPGRRLPVALIGTAAGAT